MIQQTIGQRIAGRRKLQTLSQEALAEQLQVSRQAVSKWESDAAIPEIDKLIALARIFGVSVGWLLGTEKDPGYDPSTGLSDAQLKMVEELMTRQQSANKRRNLVMLFFCLCLLATTLLLCFNLHGQILVLSEENADTQILMEALTEDNRLIQDQIDRMGHLLADQAQTDSLLSQYRIIPELSDGGSRARLDFYCWTKVVPKNADAYIAIRNPAGGISEMLKCTLMGSVFWAKANIPVANGYQYSFLLVTENGYQEQLLNSEVLFAVDLYDHSHFRASADAPVRDVWLCHDSQYTYSGAVLTPVIPIQNKNGYAGYEDVRISLLCNDEVIWEQSFRDSLREHAGVLMLSDEPWFPEIHAELPSVVPGDVLTLHLTARTHGGTELTSILETLTVVES